MSSIRFWLDLRRMCYAIVAAWFLVTIAIGLTSPIPATSIAIFVPATCSTIGVYIHARHRSLPRFNIVAVGFKEVAVRHGHLDLHAMDIDDLEHVHGLLQLRDKITSLDASANHVTAFPRWSFARLRKLDISSNAIVGTLSIARQPTLERVDAHHNQITRVDGMVAVPRLAHLDVSHNLIASIGSNDLPALRYLDLGHNRLQSLEGIGRFTGLLDLHVNCNEITLSLDKRHHAAIASLAGCTKLRLLRLLADDAESETEGNQVSKNLLQRLGGIMTAGFVPDPQYYVRFAADIGFSPRIEEPVEVFHKAAGIHKASITPRRSRRASTTSGNSRETRVTKDAPPPRQVLVEQDHRDDDDDKSVIHVVQSAKATYKAWTSAKRPAKVRSLPQRDTTPKKAGKQQTTRIKRKQPQQSLVNADAVATFIYTCLADRKYSFTFSAIIHAIGARSEHDKHKLRDELNRLVRKERLSRSGSIYHILIAK